MPVTAMSRLLRVRINGVDWSCQSGTIGIDTAFAKTSDNDSGKFENEEPISETLVVENVVAKRNVTMNPHAAPMKLSNQTLASSVAFEGFPDGVAAGLKYAAPTFNVKNFRITSNAKDGSEQTISFGGNNSGPFSKPGEAPLIP